MQWNWCQQMITPPFFWSRFVDLLLNNFTFLFCLSFLNSWWSMNTVWLLAAFTSLLDSASLSDQYIMYLCSVRLLFHSSEITFNTSDMTQFRIIMSEAMSNWRPKNLKLSPESGFIVVYVESHRNNDSSHVNRIQIWSLCSCSISVWLSKKPNKY